VTTTTISDEQYRHAREWVRRAGESRVTVLREDYRTLQGRFDKIVSIEMFERSASRTTTTTSARSIACSRQTA